MGSEAEVGLNSAVAVVDALKCKMYMKNFGEFFINQIEHAGTIILSRTGKISEEKLAACVEMLRGHNAKAKIITTPWEQLDGRDILETIEGAKDLEAELMAEVMAHAHEHHHDGEECHHGHHHDGEECHHEHHHDGEECHHEHHHDGEECHHEHHHDGEECRHDHHHDHGPDCTCGCHDHEHHHADEVFTSWGLETPAVYAREDVEAILSALEDESRYGLVLRAKGMVPAGDGSWIYFDYVPGESDVREGRPEYTGKFCVIGSKLNEENLEKLFMRK